MKRWVRVGREQRRTVNNVPLWLLRLGCHMVLWSLLTHRRPMSRTISQGLPFIGCCASCDRSSLLNDNGQQLHPRARALKQARTQYCTVRKQTLSPSPPARLPPWPFMFRKEDKYPHNRKKWGPIAFLTVHCFDYMYLLTSQDLFSTHWGKICFQW